MSDSVTLPTHPAAVLLTDAVDHIALRPDGEPCCPKCCRLCSAIRDLLAADVLDDAVRCVALSHAWWKGRRLDGQVDREWLADKWDACTCSEEPTGA